MSKIEIDDLFVNLFALPEEFVWKDNTRQSSSNNYNTDNLSSSDRSGRRRRSSSSRRQKHRRSKNTIDYEQTPKSNRKQKHTRHAQARHTPVSDSENSMLHGESISLSEDESESTNYQSDGAVVLTHENVSDNRQLNHNVSVPIRLPVEGNNIQYEINGKSQDIFATPRGSGVNVQEPELNIFHDQQPSLHIRTTKSSSDTSSLTKTKKKNRRAPSMKSIKKGIERIGGRKSSKPASTILTHSSSFGSFDSISSFHTDKQDTGSEKNMATQYGNDVDNRMMKLKSHIGRIRSNIHVLEGDLIATRNELTRANQHLQLAMSELADIQRGAMEVESKLIQHGISISPQSEFSANLSPLGFVPESDLSSTRSRSSDRLHYFTPTSSLADENDSDCFTPRSTMSFQSLLSLSERDRINTHIHDNKSVSNNKTVVIDVDQTPLKKNGMHSQRRRFFDSASEVQTATILVDSSSDQHKESNSLDTPSTAGTHETPTMSDPTSNEDVNEPPKHHRVTFRQPSFIRAHDLSLANSADNALVCLHETGVSDVVNALFEKGIELVHDNSDRWIPESTTAKVLNKRDKLLMSGETLEQPVGPWPNPAHGDEVLVWTAKCENGGHGSQYPMVKARGLIPTSALQMVSLLIDSKRSKEYNKMSLGRVDEHVYKKDVSNTCPTSGIHGELKIVRSQSQPPVIRKPVELRLLLHARRLPSIDGKQGERYITIGRSVWETQEGTADASDASTATRCEMLLSVNLIRDVQVNDDDRWCEITTITHGVSPGIPISIGKRIGLAAAAKYCRDIRAVFELHEC